MKNFLSFFLAALFCVETIFAQNFKVDGFAYRVIDGTYNVELNDGEIKEVMEIPSSVRYMGRDYKVITIGSSAFAHNSILKEIQIPSTVRTIGEFAFAGNDKLEKVVLNEGLQIIGDGAFTENTALKEIRIPSTVTLIGNEAFYGNDKLEKVVLNEGLQTIGYSSFAFNSALNEISIPSTVRTIGKTAFYENKKMGKVEFNEGLEIIEGGAFAENTALKEIRIPSTVTLIGDEAFATSETNRATISCVSAKPPTIESRTFNGRTDGVLHVMKSNVEAYKEAEYWKDFSEIIGDIVYEKRCDSPIITYENNLLTISSKMDNASIYYTTDGSIPNENAIRYLSPIQHTDISIIRAITIVEGFENSYISDYYNNRFNDFTDKQGLSYTLMQENFNGCYYYSVTGRTNEMSKDAIIPVNIGGCPVRHIGKEAFASSNIHSITIPESVKSIERGAFENCWQLKNITTKISTPFPVSAFYNKANVTLFVPKGSRNAYRKTSGWEFSIIYEEGEPVYDKEQLDEQGVIYTLMQDSDGSLYYSVTGWNDNLRKISNVVILPVIEGCLVRTIQEGWLRSSEFEIESITLPDCLNSIGASAFYECRNLSTVVFGSQLKTIGEYAFSRCSSLKSISIPDGVTEIGEFAFCHCDNMTSAIIGNGVKTLKGGTFYNCGNLTSVILGDGIARIEYSELMKDENYEECSGNYGVFSSCKNLSSINIPKTMIHIGAYAFSGCSSLTSITLPDNPSYNDISSGIFSYSGITSIKIPNHVKYINNSAFEGCSALTSVKFSENLLRIDEDAFKGCKLKSIELPNTIKEISEGLFKDCDFQYIKLGNNVTRIGKNALGGSDFVLEIGTSTPPEISSGAFPDVKYLSDLTVIVPDTKAETAYKKKAVWEDMTYANQNNIAEVTVDTPGDLSFELIDECGMMPAKVVGLKVNGSINADDFKQMLTNMKALLRLDLSDCDITEIPDSALSGKRQLQELILPSKLQTIGEKAFKDCHYLTGKLDLPTALSSVGAYAFVGTEYNSISLPYSLKTIGDYAFYQLPIEQKLTLPARLTSVGSHAFEGTNITGVTIPDVVTTIGDNAFANTPMQDHVTIPDGVTYLGKEAFSNTNISTVFLPNSVTKLSHGLFQGCKNLNLVYIPDNITDMGDYAFDGCESMVIMRLSANIETMGEYSLQGTPMDYIKVPSKVETLSRGVLKDSKNLVSLSLPANLKSVESEALYGCTALRNLSVEAIEPPVIADRSAIRGINTDLCIISIPTDSYREYVLAEYWGQFVQMRNDIAVEASGDGEISFESVVEEEGLEDTVVYSQYLTSVESEMRAPSFATKEDAQTYVNNGSSIYIPKQGQVRLHFIPGKGEKLLSATLDGEDITPHIVDNIYIATADKKNAKLVVKFSGENNTAIENVTYEESLKDSVYNLNGQLMGIDIDVTSLPKGIYIVNGKKIVVK